MFSTFDVSLNKQSTAISPRGPRPARRQQVGLRQACENCRINRIKCNEEKPCRSCQKRGTQCSNSKSNSSRSTKDAGSGSTAVVSESPSSLEGHEIISRQNEELQTLRNRLAELEHQQKEQRTAAEPSTDGDLSLNIMEYNPGLWQWEGIWTTDLVTKETLHHGPSSSFYFIDRMSRYLRERIPGSSSDELRELHTPTKSPSVLLSQGLSSSEGCVSEETLSRNQEEAYLNLFWNSYHYTCPILHVTEFREYYASLWPSSDGTSTQTDPTRQPSALVDIVLALCMQYGSAFLPQDTGACISDSETAPTGWWLYQRCQKLLEHVALYPSISRVQCQIYSVLYLRNTSYRSSANSMLASAIQTAQVLGLHLESPSSLTLAKINVRKRIWWMLFMLDSDVSIKMGRPSQICSSNITCTLPDDAEDEEAMMSFYASTNPEVSWLSYHTQSIKLCLMMRSIYTHFYMRCTEVMKTNNGKSLYEDRSLLECCARDLFESMKKLQDWISQVPGSLKISRTGGGEPFSTTRSTLVFDPQVPFWLQRQAILLELQYHSYAMYLYRPFINFPPSSTPDTPLTIRHNVSCLTHATTITNLLHQTLNEMDILNGSHEAYEYQWDAMISVLGFTLSHPICPRTPSARKAIHTSIAVLEMVGAYSQSSVGRACSVFRNVLDKIDFVNKTLQDAVFGPPSQKQSPQASGQAQQAQSQNHSPLTALSIVLDNRFSPTMNLEREEDQTHSNLLLDGNHLDGPNPMHTIMDSCSMFGTDDTNLTRNYEVMLDFELGTDSCSVDWDQVS
ncbi:hypothetical protein BP6252_00469 [Coleophoma cylindrospora]|uniref:Zn(2)-C6 fungal-type domain-containing protein n=1 Tax=Coleophoma cylindrospora TaxID=1849047 RepID=A0A3D8SQ70_9HELO|nr:hypothetical protein BP6252_00469 [Coleophoma cylindrospora]